jgi:hypothetical protein
MFPNKIANHHYNFHIYNLSREKLDFVVKNSEAMLRSNMPTPFALVSAAMILLSFENGSSAFSALQSCPQSTFSLPPRFGHLHRAQTCSRRATSLRCSAETALPTDRWPAHYVERKLSVVSPALDPAPAAPKKPDGPGPFERAVKKPTGTMSIIGSIKRSDPALQAPINDFKSAAEISAALHDAKVSAIACWIDKEMCAAARSTRSPAPAHLLTR